ncbi:MAG TPA: precorrin-4 C(11)-methyltransferase [Pseudonocardiaceae bacterium]|nr:precorrin-4 C(11)-methyltransferase [Pseudonocardiaceae bacterium]
MNQGNQGRVSFIGAGPGAADLITLRGARRIAEADIIVWAASLVDPDCIKEHAQADAELIDSSLITHEDVIEVFRRAMRDHKRVARVHSGDPSLWGAVQEQYDACLRLGIEVEIVPGVSAFSAVAAVVGRELTLPEVAQSVILTRLEGGKTPMPDGEQIREFARHGTTMAIFLSAARSGQLVEELLAGGYAEDTPVVVAYKATWPDELILHTTIGELVEAVKQHKLWRHTLFLVGRALRAGGTRSHLYNAGHFHTYRKADPAARRALRASRAGEPEVEADEPTPKLEPNQRQRSGWPLHTSRSGWVAARIANGWSPTQRGKATSADVLAGASQPASVAAWSAVQGWQETARSAPRPTARTKPEVKPAPDQGTLELDSAPEVEAVPEAATAVVEPAVVEPAVEVVTPEPVVESVAEPAVAPVVAPKQAQRAKSTNRTTPRKQTGRKPAGKGTQNRRNGGGNGNAGKS